MLEPLETKPPYLRFSVQLDRSPVACHAHFDPDIGRGHVYGFLRPFDEGDGAFAEILPQACVRELPWIVETIKIKVIQV